MKIWLKFWGTHFALHTGVSIFPFLLPRLLKILVAWPHITWMAKGIFKIHSWTFIFYLMFSLSSVLPHSDKTMEDGFHVRKMSLCPLLWTLCLVIHVCTKHNEALEFFRDSHLAQHSTCALNHYNKTKVYLNKAHYCDNVKQPSSKYFRHARCHLRWRFTPYCCIFNIFLTISNFITVTFSTHSTFPVYSSEKYFPWKW